MNPLEPEEPAALIQFAIVAIFGALFAGLILACCH